VGFSVWVNHDQAWAAGTYEYRAMGIAVIAKTDLFRPADFRRDRRRKPSADARFQGYFASIGAVNRFLQQHRPISEPRS
jgi:hypothetical protein